MSGSSPPASAIAAPNNLILPAANLALPNISTAVDENNLSSGISAANSRAQSYLSAVQSSILSSGPSAPLSVERVNQLDASQLDGELLSLLGMQFRAIFQYANPTILINYKHEIELLLNYFIYKYSMRVNNPTPGMKLQNLAYSSQLSRQQVILYGILHVLAPYLFNKFNVHITLEGKPNNLS
jgi:hypothetical protein